MKEPLIPGGYILLSRKIIESEIWDKPPLYIKVWVYLLSKAQHQDYKQLKRGQLWTSIPEIQEACSWYVGFRKETPSKDQIYRIIDWLRKSHEQADEEDTTTSMITTAKATQGLLVKIVNYNVYQTPENYERNKERGNEKDMNTTRPQQHRDNINKNVKNVNNENTSQTSKKFNEESIEYKLSKRLYQKILFNDSKTKEPNLYKWAEDIDKLIRLDNRSVEEIEDVIDFVTEDEFWKTNILSTSKLRKQFPQVYLRAKNTNKVKKTNTNSWKVDAT